MGPISIIAIQNPLEAEDVLCNQIREILRICDGEFVPPLSQRESTTMHPKKGGCDDAELISADAPDVYFDYLLRQPVRVVFSGNRMAGFLSYIATYSSPELAERTPSIQVTTICIRPEFRGRNLSTHLYENLMANPSDGTSVTQYISTRTWSTNFAHIAVLEKLGFEIVTRIRDARGDGIDTLYFSRQLPEKP